ncbi:MAG: DegT/DnrJ/EryC1/StrS family aminotransferase [Flavobacteriaceae bacterium]|nr:DegT/DnrJ/EryC1/StrS family aminotransferase [Flavobacteriaceae bacterium]
MIPFLDVHKINARFEKAFQEKLSNLIANGRFILGDEVRNFENEFAQYCGVQHCIGTGNGLDALTLILKAYIKIGKLKEGDEVIVPANTFIATIFSVLEAGLKPVFVDANPYTFNISIDDLKKKISTTTKAVIPVHLYGQLAAMDSINELAKRDGLLVIEDAAQAHGVENSHKEKAGSLSDAASFSFYPAKNLGALGDGGAITTNDDQLTYVIRQLRSYGSDEKYVHKTRGVNSRLDEVQAAFLSIKLKELDTDNARRRELAAVYLSGIKNSKVELPIYKNTLDHNFHQFVIKSDQRDALKSYLDRQGIGTMIHYPIPPHKQNALHAHRNELLPITESLCGKVLSLPISPVQTVEETYRIIEIIKAF